jgi:hypothetical protein
MIVGYEEDMDFDFVEDVLGAIVVVILQKILFLLFFPLSFPSTIEQHL